MGLSYADAQRLGIGHLHPAASGHSDQDVLRERFGVEENRPVSRSPDDGMNKTERAFAEMLKGSYYISHWWREPVRFRLAGKTTYMPDFMVSTCNPEWPGRPPQITFVEVKGFMRDDAAVKIKVAADLYPQFRWLLVRRDGKHGWDVRQVDRRGIGTSAIRIPWIHGG